MTSIILLRRNNRWCFPFIEMNLLICYLLMKKWIVNFGWWRTG